RTSRAAERTGAELGAELMLMLRLGKVTKHVRRSAEENQATAFVEQNGLMEHLKKLRARLMDRNDDDFVVRHAPNNLDHVLGIFRGESGGRLVEKINVRHTNHVETDIKAFAFATAQCLPQGAAHHRIAALTQPELEKFAFQSSHPVATRQMRRANRRRELQVLADGQLFVKGILLGNVTDVALELVKLRIERLPV